MSNTKFNNLVNSLGRVMDFIAANDRQAFRNHPTAFMLSRVHGWLKGFEADKRRAIDHQDGTAMAKALNGMGRMRRIKDYLTARLARQAVSQA